MITPPSPTRTDSNTTANTSACSGASSEDLPLLCLSNSKSDESLKECEERDSNNKTSSDEEFEVICRYTSTPTKTMTVESTESDSKTVTCASKSDSGSSVVNLRSLYSPDKEAVSPSSSALSMYEVNANCITD